MNNQLPFVSIVVPTMKSRVKFIHLLVRNILSQTYPHDRIEVLVVGDEDPVTRENFEKISSVFDKMCFKYIDCPVEYNIGKKRNFCCKASSHKIIAMMDDDDIYNREYIQHSVLEMKRLKKSIVGCKDMIITWPSLGFETRYIRGSSIHEGTMVFKKSHWKKHGFRETTSGEGTQMVQMTDGSSHNTIDIRKVMICVAHEANTSNKLKLLCDGAVLELSDDKKNMMKEIIESN